MLNFFFSFFIEFARLGDCLFLTVCELLKIFLIRGLFFYSRCKKSFPNKIVFNPNGLIYINNTFDLAT